MKLALAATAVLIATWCPLDALAQSSLTISGPAAPVAPAVISPNPAGQAA